MKTKFTIIEIPLPGKSGKKTEIDLGYDRWVRGTIGDYSFNVKVLGIKLPSPLATRYSIQTPKPNMKLMNVSSFTRLGDLIRKRSPSWDKRPIPSVSIALLRFVATPTSRSN